MTIELTEAIERAYYERNDLIVVALTGRTGSGCSTAVNAFCRNYTEISLSIDQLKDIELRKFKILNEFASKNWSPFQKITVSTAILSYLVQENWADIKAFLEKIKVSKVDLEKLQVIHTKLKSDPDFEDFCTCVTQNPWEKEKSEAAWRYFSGALESQATYFKKHLGKYYAPAFQAFGDNVRSSGSPLKDNINSDGLFSLVRRVKILAKAAFYTRKNNGNATTKIVIDAIRNSLELVYLRDQFATFYSIAITADDDDRTSRLTQMSMNPKEIQAIDDKEYSEKKSLEGYSEFVSQNLKECIQKSDVFITNRGKSKTFDQCVELNRQIVTYVSLMLRPGLVTPSRDERCMQLAFVAKLNSGCISRQVGAAIADKSYSIKAVGWNDVPKGQVSCLLRDVDDLLSSNDSEAFSDYEKSNKDFKDYLRKNFVNRAVPKEKNGLQCPFCFKSAYNEIKKDRNQVHTRSLHAEENAFMQLAKYGSSGIEGGALYTTASPCELCSKKAYQLGIREIVYVDPYPGISSSHVLASGSVAARPNLRLFSGAVGSAYHRLYESILPIKDELLARLKGSPQEKLL